MTYENIKGAKELVKKYEDEFKLIDKSIQELKKRKKNLEEDLGNSSERFTLDSIEKNSKKKHELNLVNQYLKEADLQRNELVKEAHKTSYNETKEVLSNHWDEVYYSKNHINKAIVEKLYEIRELSKVLTQAEREENGKVETFIKDIFPYLPETHSTRGAMNEYGYIQDLKHSATRATRQFIHKVPETSYLVKGLLTPNDELKKERTTPPSKLNEMYKVDHDEVIKRVEEMDDGEVPVV